MLMDTTENVHTASSVARVIKGRVPELGRGSGSINPLQSPINLVPGTPMGDTGTFADADFGQLSDATSTPPSASLMQLTQTANPGLVMIQGKSPSSCGATGSSQWVPMAGLSGTKRLNRNQRRRLRKKNLRAGIQSAADGSGFKRPWSEQSQTTPSLLTTQEKLREVVQPSRVTYAVDSGGGPKRPWFEESLLSPRFLTTQREKVQPLTATYAAAGGSEGGPQRPEGSLPSPIFLTTQRKPREEGRPLTPIYASARSEGGPQRPWSERSLPFPSFLTSQRKLREEVQPSTAIHAADSGNGGCPKRPWSEGSLPSPSFFTTQRKPREEVQPLTPIYATAGGSESGPQRPWSEESLRSLSSFLTSQKKLREEVQPSTATYTSAGGGDLKRLWSEELLPSLSSLRTQSIPKEEIQPKIDIRREVQLRKDNQSGKSKEMGKGLQSGSYSEALKTTKIAIVKNDFPYDKLSVEESEGIMRELLVLTDSIPDGHKMPKINSNHLIKGALVLQCDIGTLEWVRGNFDGKVLHDLTLKVLSTFELPKPIKVAFKTKEKFSEPSVLLRRLQRFNPELKSEGWRVLQFVTDPNTCRFIFEVDVEDVKAIKRADYRAYTGVDRGTFKIIHDPNMKPSREEVVPPVSVEM